ncbi:MAG: hypothetical protein BWX48_01388 [Verrucomicrobia bacterium ADurb.Bin006]|nr:MAG: hypothetical protein BWX48_01388 [Verrucomicrobia bacterium ADurb.Bin006]
MRRSMILLHHAKGSCFPAADGYRLTWSSWPALLVADGAGLSFLPTARGRGHYWIFREFSRLSSLPKFDERVL